MSVHHGEIGLVSASDDLVTFYREVFRLPALEARRLPTGTVHRLGPDPAILKVLVPAEKPEPAVAPPDEFWGQAGLRYFTLWVDDVNGVVERAAERGGTVVLGPVELRPRVQMVVLRDPDGNVIEVMEGAG